MSRAPCLHVPHPPARPGERPDFSYLRTSPAGAIKRPKPDVLAGETLEIANEMVRVLDENHQALGPWVPKISAEDLRVGLKHMLLTRVFDERMQRQQRQ